MIDCPKCHFRQPKDQYCANCGIDMIAYRPAPISKSKTFFESGFFQVFILLIVAALVAYFITQNDRPQSWVRKFSYSKKTTPQNLSSSKNTLNDTENSRQVDEVDVVASPSVSMNEFALNSSVESSDFQNKEDKNIPVATELRLIFAEVRRDLLNQWINESQSLGLYQTYLDFSAGILPNYKKKSDVVFKELKSEKKKYQLKKTQAILSGKTIDETSEFIGLQTNIDIKSIEEQVIKGHLVITKILRTGKFELPIEFELQKGALFFINWKTSMVGFENETNLFTTPPFQVLLSQDFLNQKTELILLLEPL